MKTLIQTYKETYFTLVRIGFAVAIAFVVSQFRFEFIEALFYDARVRLKPISPVSGHIELVAIDSATVEKLGRVPNAADHVKLLDRLKNAGARAIIYLVNPNDIVGTNTDIKTLAQRMDSLSAFYVAVPDMTLRGEDDAFKILPPYEKLKVFSSPKTVDRNIFAGDEVTRRMIVSYQGRQTLTPVIATLLDPPIVNERKIHGLFDYLQSKQVYIDYRPAKTYPQVSFQTLANAPADSETPDATRFHDKIVIVGRDIQTTAKDYARTPFSRDIVAMTVLELNANMLDTLILNRAPTRAPPWIDFLCTALISILTVHVVLLLRPTRGLIILGVALSSFFLFGYLLFWWARVWIGIAQPSVAIFICYYFFIPYRLIIENRRSWEYFQKNRLLTQVEELKTNFLSMMSHDLKTPIARIQGMTDVVLNDPTPLSDSQSNALRTLRTSSDELLDFVSSILNLGRIESKEVKLELRSKDPNGLLTEIIAKLDHLAKSKNIEIIPELEPLFSLRMDVDLMRQVFSNLIENAIKYSHENSRILIGSEETGACVVIQVADQGVGIPESECPFIFDKFYRASDAKTSVVKGSGLGLYLAKYFVELHNGTISVDSRPGVGSTFTVELPLHA